jgi:uncharacterized protein YjbI with pentapeptide repeats
MNDENPVEQTNLSEVSEEQKGQLDNKASAPKPDEVKKLELQESFKKIHDRSDKFSHEWDLKREAENLDMKVEEYRHWYELRPKPRTWFYWIFHHRVAIWIFQLISGIWRCTGFGEKKLWDVLQLIIVPLVLAGGAYYLQELAKQREQTAAIEKTNQDTLVNYLDQMAELLQKGLLKTKINSETFIIAQAKTVIALQSLDPKRQHLVIQFLDAAKLNTLDRNKELLNQAQMSKANLSNADLSGANLNGAELSRADLTHADLSYAHLNEADLSRAELSRSNLIYAGLTGTNLNEANLTEANLTHANLHGANLNEANLTHAGLIGANLNEANLTHAILTDANLHGANLTHANFTDADLTGAKLSKEQLDRDKAKLCRTTLPDGEFSDRNCEKPMEQEEILKKSFQGGAAR